ncbi:MAG: acyl-CoA desaturase [Saprospiraceae bacterium]|nr:acyl-CoA desaturase [Saprospiraceae bacterium]
MDKTIKFRIKNQDDAFFQELREEVGKYIKTQPNGPYGNGIILIKAALFLSLFWGAYGCILFAGLPNWANIACYASMGISGLFIAFNIAHDAAHGTLTRAPGWNKVIYYLTFNPLGTDAYLWGMRHNQSHHLFPNVDGVDVDIDSNYLVRLSPNRPLLPHHRWQYLYAPLLYGLFTLQWVLIKDWHYLFRKNLANLRNIQHPAMEIAGVVLAKIFHFTYLILLPVWLGIPIGVVLLGYLMYHVVMSYFFLFTNIMNHHSEEAAFPRRDAEGYLPGSWAQHQIHTCLDFHPTSSGWSFFFGGFNAHAAHHLFPNICHVHYPVISTFIKRLATKHKVQYRQSEWWSSLKSHFRHMKSLGQTPPASLITTT